MLLNNETSLEMKTIFIETLPNDGHLMKLVMINN